MSICPIANLNRNIIKCPQTASDHWTEWLRSSISPQARHCRHWQSSAASITSRTLSAPIQMERAARRPANARKELILGKLNSMQCKLELVQCSLINKVIIGLFNWTQVKSERTLLMCSMPAENYLAWWQRVPHCSIDWQHTESMWAPL